MYCVNCGIENSDDSRFCRSCGNELRKLLISEISETEQALSIDDTQPIPKINPISYENADFVDEEDKNKPKKISKIYQNFKEKFPLKHKPKFHFNFKSKKKMVIVVSVSLIILASITVFSFSDTGIKYRLKYYGDHKNEEKLVSFIERNKTNNDKIDLVLFGVHQIVANDIDKGISYLDKEIYSKENNFSINSYIISEMNKFKILPKDPDKFCSFYITEYILNQNTGTAPVINNGGSNVVDSSTYWDGVLSLIKMYKKEDIENSFYTNILSLYSDKKHNEAVALIMACNTLNIGNNENNLVLKGLIETLIENEQKIENNTNNINSINTIIEETRLEIENENTLLTDSNNKIVEVNDAIKKLKSDLAVKKNYVNLRFYCLIEHDKNMYEIILPKKSPLFGEILSSTHAILYATNSKLSAKTWNNINVYKQGNKAVVLKGYGNIKQEITTYKEVSKSDYSEIDKLETELKDKNTLLDELNKTAENQKATINEMQSIISEKEIESSELLAEIETLKTTNNTNDADIKKHLSND